MTKYAQFVVWVVVTSSISPLSAQPAGIADPALDSVRAQALRHRSAFYVYENADSGLNHSFPSGFFPAGATNKIHLDPACVFDAASANGCSTVTTRLDRDRGTVLRITIDPLLGSEFVGLNFEEPENYGTRLVGNGYDLRDTTRVCFEAYAPTNGFRVEFSVAQRSAGYRTLANAWTTICLDWTAFGVTRADLENVHYPFTVGANAANAPGGGTVLLDRIRFEPVPPKYAAALSLPVSNQTFGVIPVASPLAARVPIPPDQLMANLATVYESSLAVLALLARNSAQDQAAAKIVADTFVYANQNDNAGLPLPIGSDLSTGLHSAYSSGDIGLFNDQMIGAAKSGQIRLAGFTANSCGASKFCLVLDGATGGNAAFAIIALTEAFQKIVPQDGHYRTSARNIGNWIYNRMLDSTGTGYGGYYLGYPDEGKPKNLILAKSVENNADIFRAFTKLGDMASQAGNTNEATEWYRRAKIAGDFVMAMFDPGAGRFFAGTVPPGTAAADGIVPNGTTRGSDVINTFDFLDAQTFTVLPMAASPLYRNAIDWRRPVQWMIDHQAKVVTAAGTQFQGFNLVTTPAQGPQGIAWEFTAQAVVAMRFVDALYGEQRFAPVAQTYLQALRKAQLQAPFGDTAGIVGATMQGGDTLPPYEQCMTTPFQCIAERVGMAATAWGALADLNVNPFGAPVGLSIVLPLPGQTIAVSGVSFQWTRTAGATGYGLRIKKGADTVFEGSLAGELSTSTLISLDNGSYTFQVRPCNGGFTDAECGLFAAVNFTVALSTASAAPTIVSPTAGQNFTSSTQTFQWTAVAGVERYEVELTDVAAGNEIVLAIAISGATPPTNTVFSMKDSANYSLRVRACLAACGPWSPSVNFSVTLPAVPTGIPDAPSCTVQLPNRVSCAWNAIANADIYEIHLIQFGAGPGGGALSVASRQVSTTSTPNQLVSTTGTVQAIVAACNGNGCGPFSTATPVVVPGPNSSVPVLGTPVANKTVPGPDVQFSWSRIPGDNGANTIYQLYVQDLARNAPALDIRTTANAYAAKFKSRGSRYDAVVVANPSLPGQAVGSPVGFTVVGGGTVSPTMVQPRHQTAEVALVLPQGNIQLGWTPVIGSTLYEYFVAVSGQSNPAARGVTPGLFVQVPLTVGFGGAPQTYSGIVRACQPGLTCAFGSETNWGPWSNAAGQAGVTTFRVGP